MTTMTRAPRWIFFAGLGLAGLVSLWIWWAEENPDAERDLRLSIHDKLALWFPEQMQPTDGWHGLLHACGSEAPDAPAVVLVHGLDEPGDIWDDLKATLSDGAYAVWELRYPNDQAVDRSAAFLAERWEQLPTTSPVVLIGHSMGGLVVREFVTAWRHPSDSEPRTRGAPVHAAILVGTPNHGSEWARLRMWLELRDHFPDDRKREFSLFAGLRDGCGEAKIDLRPGSTFLRRLNARPWPELVDMHLIAGILLDDKRLGAGFDALLERIPDPEGDRALRAWWADLSEDLGDGVVTVESVALPGQPAPTVLPVSHRELLLRMIAGTGTPPAIPVIQQILRDLREGEPGR